MWYERGDEVVINKIAPGVDRSRVGPEEHVLSVVKNGALQPLYRVHLGTAVIVVPHWALKRRPS
jgi:hypothetical protein